MLYKLFQAVTAPQYSPFDYNLAEFPCDDGEPIPDCLSTDECCDRVFRGYIIAFRTIVLLNSHSTRPIIRSVDTQRGEEINSMWFSCRDERPSELRPFGIQVVLGSWVLVCPVEYVAIMIQVRRRNRPVPRYSPMTWRLWWNYKGYCVSSNQFAYIVVRIHQSDCLAIHDSVSFLQDILFWARSDTSDPLPVEITPDMPQAQIRGHGSIEGGSITHQSEYGLFEVYEHEKKYTSCFTAETLDTVLSSAIIRSS